MSGTIEIRVRYAETDQMGRAHHSHYLVWCELGRSALMRERGLSYGSLEARGVRLPVSRAQVEYRRPVGYDALVRVETRVEEVRSREVVFTYRISHAETGETLALARTSLVSIGENGRPVRLTPDVRAVLVELAGAT